MRNRMKYGLLSFCSSLIAAMAASALAQQPNILWITSEDNGPHLGCYGDRYATTPSLDNLAARGVRYINCWSNVPVCAPARTALITGMYPTSLGAQHMRSWVSLPPGVRMFPQILREHGYYCTNNSKEDYNAIKPGQVWDESSRNAHWRNRQSEQPFFAVFNFTVTHESQIRKRPHEPIHDPQAAPLPPYHPETAEVRQDWAQYYDKLTVMDRRAGEKLAELEAAGLADDTIVFYFSDHGCGLPRHKRAPNNSGMHVPLIVYIPEKFANLNPARGDRNGSASDRLVSFVDFAPTALSLAGIQPPESMQGTAFLGPHAGSPRDFIYGSRDRMDERYDMSRSVRDQRLVYIRHYAPELPAGQYLDYQFLMPTTRIWKQQFDAQQLNDVQSAFWRPKPAEELFDLSEDPFETRNLAEVPRFQVQLEHMRKAHLAWVLETRDSGFLPESEMHRLAAGRSIYEAISDDAEYPLQEIVRMAEWATSGRAHPEPDAPVEGAAIRYWLARGLRARCDSRESDAFMRLQTMLEDDAPCVRVVAARAVAEYGNDQEKSLAVGELLELADFRRHTDFFAILAAMNAIDEVDSAAGDFLEELKELPTEHQSIHARNKNYLPRLMEKILADLAAGS